MVDALLRPVAHQTADLGWLIADTESSIRATPAAPATTANLSHEGLNGDGFAQPSRIIDCRINRALRSGNALSIETMRYPSCRSLCVTLGFQEIRIATEAIIDRPGAISAP